MAKAISFFLARYYKIDPYHKFFRNRSVFFGRWIDLSLGDDGSSLDRYLLGGYSMLANDAM